ncbi:MAG: UDP-2,3-diacylglucosamine diphosphatase LpxI [bacterium]|nr:UDP-2,3-diacylglucosamine diphosphatase LpxI [bacterium]
MTPSPVKIGIIAGAGELPGYVARSLAQAGKNLYVAALEGAADQIVEDDRWETGWFRIHDLRELLDGLKTRGVTGIVLAGRVAHAEVFKADTFDGFFRTFLEELADHRASTILGGIVDLFRDNGMKVLALDEIVPDLMPPVGHLAGPAPSQDLDQDLVFGWRIARSVADLDIGQTVVVKDRSVVAVEAMEGTDAVIRRAIEVAGGGITVVKLAAINHDFRYDVPTVGKETVARIAEGGGALVVEGGRCTILGFEEVVSVCSEGGVTLLSCREDKSGEVLWTGG